MKHRRFGFTAYELLAVVAVMGILVGMLMVAVVKARLAAGRIESLNNLRQIALAVHIYADANNGSLLAGNDANNYSALARLLPYVEEQKLFEGIDFSKPVDAKANDKARKTMIKLFLSPLDPQKAVRDDMGATNYLFCAGSKPGLKNNDGVFCLDSALTLAQIANADGTSNTLMCAETLKGDGGTKPVDVRRQHVLLVPEKPKDAPQVKVDEERVQRLIADLGSNQFDARKKAAEELEKLGEPIEALLKKAIEGKPMLEVSQRLDSLLQKIAKLRIERLEGPIRNLKDDAGAADWKAGTNIVGDRAASWMDGRFLQTTFSANMPFNDARPDVNASGLGGQSSMRNMGNPTIAAAFMDGHVQNIPVTIKLDLWKALATWNGGEVVQLP